MINNARHGGRSVGSIPMDEQNPLTSTNKQRNEFDTAAATNSHDNLEVDDGLLDGDGVGPTGTVANEPSEGDAEGQGRVVELSERPRTKPRPRPRSDNPVLYSNPNGTSKVLPPFLHCSGIKRYYRRIQ